MTISLHRQYGGNYEGPLAIQREEAEFDIRMGQAKAQEVFDRK